MTVLRERECDNVGEGRGSLSMPSWLSWTSVIPLTLLTFFLLSPAVARAQSAIRRPKSGFKGFSGLWLNPDSFRQVYHHDQTIAVVELGPGKRLDNCELIEIMKPEEEKPALKSLSAISKPIHINFEQMMQLMSQCQELATPLEPEETSTVPQIQARQIGNPFTLLNGILPGTKWCGTGDLAKNYHDLGEEKAIDRCCRTHDLCPVKVRAYQTNYNLTNNSFYTKSHCACDDRFHQCLKQIQHPTANMMGSIYFTILRVQCIQDLSNKCSGSECKPPAATKRVFRSPKNRF